MQNEMKGIWNRITIYCMNHDEPKPMEILQNLEQIKTPFYACTDEHCPNRLNLDDYQGLVLEFIKAIDEEGYFGTDFTNYTYTYKGTRQKVKAKILKYSGSEIRIGILNTTVLGIKK